MRRLAIPPLIHTSQNISFKLSFHHCTSNDAGKSTFPRLEPRGVKVADMEARDSAASVFGGRREIYNRAGRFKEVVLRSALTYNLVRPTHLKLCLENRIRRLGNTGRGKDVR